MINVFDPYFCFHQLIFLLEARCQKCDVLKIQGVELGAFLDLHFQVLSTNFPGGVNTVLVRGSH